MVIFFFYQLIKGKHFLPTAIIGEADKQWILTVFGMLDVNTSNWWILGSKS